MENLQHFMKMRGMEWVTDEVTEQYREDHDKLPGLSINNFNALYGEDDWDACSAYMLAYYLQQNRERLSDKLVGEYEKKLSEAGINLILERLGYGISESDESTN